MGPNAEGALRRQVAATPDATLLEHWAAWTASGHAPVSVATMGGRSTKDPDRPRKGRRAAACVEMATVDPTRLVSLDVTSTPTTLTPLRGQRVVGRVPRGRWDAVTLVATWTPAEPSPGLQLEGALDRDAFDTFVTDGLVASLHSGDVVMLDNLSVHKSLRAQQAIEAASKKLGNTPPICRRSYVHPVVNDAYLDVGTVKMLEQRAEQEIRNSLGRLEGGKEAVLVLLQQRSQAGVD